MKKYERHGHSVAMKRTKTYQAWRNMISRCTNSSRPDYHYYGARGIGVCKRWLTSFNKFLKDMGEAPEGLSLDRKNNGRGYSPANCRWATKDEQMQNTRATRIIQYRGISMGVGAWARRVGLSVEGLRARLKKMDIHDALTTPTAPHFSRTTTKLNEI
jgi:hypothetical protein